MAKKKVRGKGNRRGRVLGYNSLSSDSKDLPEKGRSFFLSGGPKGHNLKDNLDPFKMTIEETLDNNKIGVQHDKPVHALIGDDLSLHPVSPFWAD